MKSGLAPTARGINFKETKLYHSEWMSFGVEEKAFKLEAMTSLTKLII